MANPNEIDKRTCPVCGSWMEVVHEVYGNKFVNGVYNCELCGLLKVGTKLSRQPVTLLPACPDCGMEPVVPLDSALVMDDAAEYRCTKCGMNILRDSDRKRLTFVDPTGRVLTFAELAREKEERNE